MDAEEHRYFREALHEAGRRVSPGMFAWLGLHVKRGV